MGRKRYTNQNRTVPHDYCGQLDGARIEVISYKGELPAFATRDPSKGPFSRGVLDEVSSDAKKDDNVKQEAKERGRPFLNKRYAVNMDTSGLSRPLRDNAHKHVF
jgi:hypothetical protein